MRPCLGSASGARRADLTFTLLVVLAALVSMASPGGATAAPNGLVAAYGFDEGSGTTVADASGNGHTGTITAATWAATGKYGKALQFNGSSALVTVPDAASLHLSSAMTLEAWVNPSNVEPRWRDVVYKGDDNYYLEATSRHGSPAGARRASFGGSYADALRHGRALRQHLDAPGRSPTTAPTLRLYVNGTQVAHAGAGAARSPPRPTRSRSAATASTASTSAGLIDEVRVYNLALTPAQIQTDMATPVAPAAPDTQPPTAPGTLTATAVCGGRGRPQPGAPRATTSASPATRSSAARAAAAPIFAQIAPTTAPAPATRTPASAAAPATATASAPPTPPATSAPYSNTATATTHAPDPTRSRRRRRGR